MELKKRLQKFNFVYTIHNFLSHNKVKGKTFIYIGKYVSLKNNKIKCEKQNEIIIEDHTVIHNSKISIFGNNNRVILHNNVILTSTNITINAENCFIEIGAETSLNEAELYCGDRNNHIKIGSHCLFGFGCLFMTWDAHTILDYEQKQVNKSGNIDIANHVWLASHCTVFCNTSIGENTVVGSHAFLKNKMLKPRSVYVKDGVQVRDNITWKV